MEPLAPHQKVFVDRSFAQDENHGGIRCSECHGGNPQAEDYLVAHQGVVRDPSETDPEAACGGCHPDIVASAANSLHATLTPFATVIEARTDKHSAVNAEVHAGRRNHCNACHASCGQCHVSRPKSVGGGLLDGHAFQRTPPWREVCTACHGSRIEWEYLGKNQGAPPDVHWRKRFFRCEKCHTGQEMHGDGTTPANRYHVANGPTCEGCHMDIYGDAAPNRSQHATHRGRVACQVCHAVPYKNCRGCHVALDRYGFRYFINQESSLDFKIGRNVGSGSQRRDIFVTVRHVPVARDAFRFYVEHGLTEFDAVPTWKLATPHNIQRRTPQNADCNTCHGNRTLFLLPGDLTPADARADANVAVPEEMIPARVKTPGIADKGASSRKTP